MCVVSFLVRNLKDTERGVIYLKIKGESLFVESEIISDLGKDLRCFWVEKMMWFPWVTS